jgi:hypothetical protein
MIHCPIHRHQLPCIECGRLADAADAEVRRTVKEPGTFGGAYVTMNVETDNGLVSNFGTRMSTDLPAADLGEMLAQAIERAYQQGVDPVRDGLKITVTFR